jgi:hypothetical protein
MRKGLLRFDGTVERDPAISVWMPAWRLHAGVARGHTLSYRSKQGPYSWDGNEPFDGCVFWPWEAKVFSGPGVRLAFRLTSSAQE